MVLMWCLVLIVLSGIATPVDSQLDSNGFINIDSGLPANSTFVDSTTELSYVSDDQFIDTGEIHNVSSVSSSSVFKTLRSFPSGTRNCYTLALTPKRNYLVRGRFYYGNYDKLQKPPIFDVYLGINYWDTIDMTMANDNEALYDEIIASATTDYLQVCLINKGRGTPFISALELRQLNRNMYPEANSTRSLVTFVRLNLGLSDISLTRYPDDLYDRFWTNYTDVTWKNIYTDSPIVKPDRDYEAPSVVMQTAAITSSPKQSLNISWNSNDNSTEFMAIFHIGEIQNIPSTDTREFDILINGILVANDIVPIKLLYRSLVIYSIRSFTSYKISLKATSNSTLPPLLNGFELYIVASLKGVPTDGGGVAAINTIKRNYDVQKLGWSGDPCVPTNVSWTGVNCTSDSTSNAPRITSLNLSSSGLTGALIPSFGTLTALKSLDLSNNNLSGTLPTSLDQLTALTYLDISGNSQIDETTLPSGLQKRRQEGKLEYKYYPYENVHQGPIVCCKKPRKVVPIVIVVAAVVLLIVAAIATILCLKRRKYNRSKVPKSNESVRTNPAANNHEKNYANTPEANTQGINAGPNNGDGPKHNIAGAGMLDFESRRFSYDDLIRITNKFQIKIGTGGFGNVYVGALENGTQVAVKLRSQSSRQGVREFLTEAQNLTRVHHKNLVSLLGYCMDGDHMALVYEYMPEGNLQDKLKDIERPLTWKQRLRIAYESAQGLEYLHMACNPPLIHRDVKTNNILLNKNLEAKLADFGLSKAFDKDGSSNIPFSTRVVGTLGYLDPEYYSSYQLSTKSDVYSLGVVLLEIITGRPPIGSSEGGHLTQWVSENLSRGNIKGIVDPRMCGQYNINSVWKVANLAGRCTKQTSSKRPTMKLIVDELSESLNMETSTYANQHNYMSENYTSDVSQNSFCEMAHMENMPAPAPTAR